MPFKTHKDNECVDQIARNFVSNIIDGTESTVKKKLEDAEYDKTFSCNILGINQVFSDEVKKSTQEYLIKAHNIPEISEGEEYYTVKIEGHFYCIKQVSVYGMEENVTVKVPNGDWNKMYISTAGKVKGLDISGTVLGQVKFTAGRAYYNGEEYVLQRGNNRRIIAVSKGDKCSIIDTPFDASELDAETAATTAILNGLDSKATAEATFNVKKDEYVYSFFTLDSTEDATIDWGDGTVEPIIDYKNFYHKYTISGTITQKITASKATKVLRINDNSRENVLYIGGNIETASLGWYTKMVVWGNKIKETLSSAGSFGGGVKYKCDIAFPPFGTTGHSWGNNVNYCYIPETCVSFTGSMQSDTFEQIEIEPKGADISIDTDYLFGTSGHYVGKSLISCSLPSRVKIANHNYMDFAVGRAIKYFRFETGHTVISECFMPNANKNQITKTYSKAYVYIPKTITSICYAAFASPVHFVYEGTYAEWNKIEKNNRFVINGGTSNVGTYELSCPNAPNDGGLRYDNFESDVKNAGTKAEINAGDGITVDNNSNTVSLSINKDSGLTFTNDQLDITHATNINYGTVKLGDPALSMLNGVLCFCGEASGCFNGKDVGYDKTYLQELPSAHKVKSYDTIIALVSENRAPLAPLYAIYITPFYKHHSGSNSYPTSNILWTIGNTSYEIIEKIRVEDGNILFTMASSGGDYDVTWFIKRNSTVYTPNMI